MFCVCVCVLMNVVSVTFPAAGCDVSESRVLVKASVVPDDDADDDLLLLSYSHPVLCLITITTHSTHANQLKLACTLTAAGASQLTVNALFISCRCVPPREI